MLTVHETAACKEQVINCLNTKPASTITGLIQPPPSLSKNIFAAQASATVKQSKLKGDRPEMSNTIHSLKQTQFANVRPKSMDIAKLFHV